VLLVGFIIRIYHDAWSPERQMHCLNSNPITVWRYGYSDHGVGLIQLTAGARDLSFLQSMQMTWVPSSPLSVGIGDKVAHA